MRIQQCPSSQESENPIGGSKSTPQFASIAEENPRRPIGFSARMPMHQYAWLERDGAMWHFLTNLVADPQASARRWPDDQQALAELMEEGWKVVRPYVQRFPAGSAERIDGYGLTRRVQ